MHSYPELVITPSIICFVDKRSGRLLWSIPKDKITITKNIAGTYLSACILYLLDRDWAAPELLYELADIIQQHKPHDLYINWPATFFAVEKHDYLRRVHSLKYAACSNAEVANLPDEEDNSAEINYALMDIVYMNLNRYNLL